MQSLTIKSRLIVWSLLPWAVHEGEGHPGQGACTQRLSLRASGWPPGHPRRHAHQIPEPAATWRPRMQTALLLHRHLPGTRTEARGQELTVLGPGARVCTSRHAHKWDPAKERKVMRRWGADAAQTAGSSRRRVTRTGRGGGRHSLCPRPRAGVVGQSSLWRRQC